MTDRLPATFDVIVHPARALRGELRAQPSKNYTTRYLLAAALADGTIDAVATDHAPHARHDKEHTFEAAAFGMLGLETAFPVVHEVMVRSGRITLAQLAERMSHAPARIAGLAEHGQPLAAGAPANLVLVDPERVVTVDAGASNSLSRNNPWHGMSFTGAVHTTILRGRITAREGKAVTA